MGIWVKAYGPGGSHWMSMAPFIAIVKEKQAFYNWSVHASLWHHTVQALLNVSAATYPRAKEHSMLYVSIYTTIYVATGAATIASIVVQFMGGLRASRVLFEHLSTAVVQATMRWHVSYSPDHTLKQGSDTLYLVGHYSSWLNAQPFQQGMSISIGHSDRHT